MQVCKLLMILLLLLLLLLLLFTKRCNAWTRQAVVVACNAKIVIVISSTSISSAPWCQAYTCHA